MDNSQTRSLLFSDYQDWYRLRSLLLRLSEWTMGGTVPYLSAGDLQVACEYAERLNDVDCTYTLKQVKEMGWTPPGKSAGPPPQPPAPDPERLAKIAACPTPVYHETHRYCPSCPWTEADITP